jgi:hypothetical protein
MANRASAKNPISKICLIALRDCQPDHDHDRDRYRHADQPRERGAQQHGGDEQAYDHERGAHLIGSLVGALLRLERTARRSGAFGLDSTGLSRWRRP